MAAEDDGANVALSEVTEKVDYRQDGSANAQTKALTYAADEATEAKLGDHMELRVEEKVGGTFDDFSYVNFIHKTN